MGLIWRGITHFVQNDATIFLPAAMDEPQSSCQTPMTHFFARSKARSIQIKIFHIYHFLQLICYLELKIPSRKYLMPSPVRNVTWPQCLSCQYAFDVRTVQPAKILLVDSYFQRTNHGLAYDGRFQITKFLTFVQFWSAIFSRTVYCIISEIPHWRAFCILSPLHSKLQSSIKHPQVYFRMPAENPDPIPHPVARN